MTFFYLLLIFICFDLFLFESNLRRNRFIVLSSELDAQILDRGKKKLYFRIFPLGLSKDAILIIKFCDRCTPIVVIDYQTIDN